LQEPFEFTNILVHLLG